MPTVQRARGLPRATRMQSSPVVVASLAPEHVEDLVFTLDLRIAAVRSLFRDAPAPERRVLQAEYRRLRRLADTLVAALDRRQAA